MGAFTPVAPTVNHFGGAFVPGAAVGKFSARFSLLLAGIYWGFAPYPPPSFLPLMEEKKAKEDQAPTGGGEVGRVRVGVGEGGGKGAGCVLGAYSYFLFSEISSSLSPS